MTVRVYRTRWKGEDREARGSGRDLSRTFYGEGERPSRNRNAKSFDYAPLLSLSLSLNEKNTNRSTTNIHDPKILYNYIRNVFQIRSKVNREKRNRNDSPTMRSNGLIGWESAGNSKWSVADRFLLVSRGESIEATKCSLSRTMAFGVAKKIGVDDGRYNVTTEPSPRRCERSNRKGTGETRTVGAMPLGSGSVPFGTSHSNRSHARTRTRASNSRLHTRVYTPVYTAIVFRHR